MKKVFIIIALSLFLAVPLIVRAADAGKCDCTFIVTGGLCKINQKYSFNFGDKPTVQSLLDKVSWTSCPEKSFVPAGYKIRSLEVTQERCGSAGDVNTNATVADTTYNLSVKCVLTGAAAGTAGGAAGATATDKKPACPDKQTCLENPIGTTDLRALIGTIIKAALGIIGSLTLLMLVWGGFKWLTSGGNAERIKSGTQTMVWAVVGVVLVMASYIILTTYLNYLTGGTGGGSTVAGGAELSPSGVGGVTPLPESKPADTPTCKDGIKNQDETGVDCGGKCLHCAGHTCNIGADCAGNLCMNGKCS
jgi:hypothetical protein